ncbi:hypothetical protein [Pseudanabaena sp. PCC 6802]|uniref:hypothetical protein n=1 Tax=Pseudanabaena sp. PCC 6802 TaxID=118173 RepID=UPI000349F177|nr:hypothetical protein [Pseudanabaena sp. PCC 6802]
MLNILTSETFWAAFSALVAFAALLFTIVGVIIAMYTAGKWRRLQSALQKERKFYEEQARRVAHPTINLPGESTTERYLKSIDNGLLAIAQLSSEQREHTKDKLRDLLGQLRATHTTLVNELKPFMEDNAKKFFKGFNKFNRNFGVRYDAGNIPHNARTHCDDVVGIIKDVASQLESDGNATKTPSDVIYKIREIGYSMEYADQEVIVPIMRFILSKTEVELSLINSAIIDGDMRKAIWLKERYRFDIKNLYGQLDEALTTMSSLTSKL